MSLPKLALLAALCLPQPGPRQAVWTFEAGSNRHEGALTSPDGKLSLTEPESGILMTIPLSRLNNVLVYAIAQDETFCAGTSMANVVTDDGKDLMGCWPKDGLVFRSGSTEFAISRPRVPVKLTRKP